MRCAALVVALAAGCGGGGGGYTDPDQFMDDLEAAFCDKAVECGILPSTDRCVNLPVESYDGVTWMEAAIADGRIVFHGDAALACVEGIRTLSCRRFLNRPELADDVPECRQTTSPDQREGEPCFDDAPPEADQAECVWGTRCELPSGCNEGLMCCAGTCVADGVTYGDAGAACDEITSACRDPAVCVDGTCAVGDDVGEPCGSTCGGALYCDDGICRAFSGTTAAEGEPCGLELACEDGTFCIAGMCMRLLGPGEACDPDPAAALFCNTAWLTCVDGVCTENLAPGEACTPEGAECLGGTPCFDGACPVRQADGAPCAGNPDCSSDNCMDGTCQPPLTCP